MSAFTRPGHMDKQEDTLGVRTAYVRGGSMPPATEGGDELWSRGVSKNRSIVVHGTHEDVAVEDRGV